MRPHRGARAARGVLVALFATFVALMSHVAGGGEVPGWLGLFAPLILAFAVSTVLTGRRLSLLRLAASVFASQLLFHTMFTLGGPEGASVFHGHHHAMTQITDASLTVDHVHGPGGMWVAHAAAAAITIAGLYIGERSILVAAAAVAGAQAWLRRTAAVLAAPAVLSPAPAMQVAAPAVRVLQALCVLLKDRRRGPPFLLCI